MLRACKYRLYPDIAQREQLARTFGCVRFVYNYYLDKKIRLYEESKQSISKTDCNNHLNRELKVEFTWLREVDKFALTNSIYNLDSAFQNFYRRLKEGTDKAGFPRFKRKCTHRYSYKTNLTNNNIEIDFIENKIKLPKLKWVKAKIHRSFDGKIKSAVISQNPSGKYF